MSERWYGEASAVATLTFDVDAETPILAKSGRYARHASVMSHQAYGPEVGVPRLLDLLDELVVSATFFVPGWVAEHRPGLAASIVERGHEVAHHTYSHRAPTSLTETEERADFERALEVFAAQGITISGYRAATWEASWRTVPMLAEYGLRYDSSLMGDDRPYRITTGPGEIVELPVHWSLDDWEQYAYLPAPEVGSVIESPRKVLELWLVELDVRRDGAAGAAAGHARSYATNILNLYSCSLAALSVGLRIARWKLTLIAGVVASVVLAVFVNAGAFATAFDHWMVSILVWISPWAGIVLVDFFLLRKGTLDVGSLYSDRAPAVRLHALLSLAAGLVAAWSWQFGMVTLMRGPLAVTLANTDFSWLSGSVVAGGLYYLLSLRATARVPVQADA